MFSGTTIIILRPNNNNVLTSEDSSILDEITLTFNHNKLSVIQLSSIGLWMFSIIVLYIFFTKVFKKKNPNTHHVSSASDTDLII